MAIKKRNGLVIMTKTTWRKNRFTKNICVTERELEAIYGGDIDQIEVFAPDYAHVVALITDPIKAVSTASISDDGEYYLISYAAYILKNKED